MFCVFIFDEFYFPKGKDKIPFSGKRMFTVSWFQPQRLSCCLQKIPKNFANCCRTDCAV